MYCSGFLRTVFGVRGGIPPIGMTALTARSIPRHSSRIYLNGPGVITPTFGMDGAYDALRKPCAAGVTKADEGGRSTLDTDCNYFWWKHRLAARQF